MIHKVKITNFKKFKDATIELHNEGVTMLVGGNNSGKTTFLHALATWSYCCIVLKYQKHPNALYAGFNGDGYGVSLADFTPMNIPSFDHLWPNLKSTGPYTMKITCFWMIGDVEKHLTISLNVVQDRLFIKNGDSNVAAGEKIPMLAYLPSFAGIASKEEWYSQASRNKLIGQGVAGAVLRNQIMELYFKNAEEKKRRRGDDKRLKKADVKWLLENDPYEILNQTIYEIFKGIIIPTSFDPTFNTYVNINFAKVTKSGLTYRLLHGFNRRDIMVEGSGFLQWLSVYTFVLSPEIDTVLLDEPDAHLHSTLQSVLMDKLCNLAVSSHKQVLVTSHSVELIKAFDYSSILDMKRNSYKYLNEEKQKVKILAGIGTEYFPRLEAVQQNKRVLFTENESDVVFLKDMCSKFAVWPENLVSWPLANKHSERTHLYLYLKDEIRDLKCLSLSDRDTLPKEFVNASLEQTGVNDNIEPHGELRYRTWRRMEIESYLFSVNAIAKAIVAKQGGVLAARITEVEGYLHDNHGLTIPADIKNSNPSPESEPFFDLDPKTVINPLCRHFKINKHDIAKNMDGGDVFDDVRTLINELIAMC